LIKRIGIVSNHPACIPLVRQSLALAPEVGVAASTEADLINLTLETEGLKTRLHGGEVYAGRMVPRDGLPEGWLQAVQPQIVLVFLYPQRIGEEVFNKVPHGVWNFHPAPLPEFRGADPVFWMLRRGLRRGGLTVHRMVREWDAGAIFQFFEENPGPVDTQGSYLRRLSERAAEAAVVLVGELQKKGLHDGLGDIPTSPQQETQARMWRRPELADLFLRWDAEEADSLACLVKAANPYFGGARTVFQGSALQVFEAEAFCAMEGLQHHAHPQSPHLFNAFLKNVFAYWAEGLDRF
jgi:methionyl-tRNA formyltransferase